ncbi:hypothetical protein [Thalassotalea litorea]|uniref:hypothetical protein n=1 Tax=Thalassotalea litorea TaxID=2020715 RepID=UPI003736009D
MKTQSLARITTFTCQLLWWAAYLAAGAGMLIHWVANGSVFNGAHSSTLAMHYIGQQESAGHVGTLVGYPASSLSNQDVQQKSAAAVFYTSKLSDLYDDEPDVTYERRSVELALKDNTPLRSGNEKMMGNRLYRWSTGVSLAMGYKAYTEQLRYLNLSEPITLQDDLAGPGTYQIIAIRLMSETALREWLIKIAKQDSVTANQWFIVHSPYREVSAETRYVIVAKRVNPASTTRAVSYTF